LSVRRTQLVFVRSGVLILYRPKLTQY